MSDKEFRATLRIQNHRLIKLREDLGLNQGQAATEIGICASQLGRFESLKMTPIGKSGAWIPTAIKIAEYFGADLEWIWPMSILAYRGTGRYVTELSGDEIQNVLAGEQPQTPLEIAERNEIIDDVQRQLVRLPERERDIVMSIYGNNETFKSVGDRYGLTRERIRQISLVAIRKLRHPSLGSNIVAHWVEMDT